MSDSQRNTTETTTRVHDRRKNARTLISAPVRVRGVEGSFRNFDETTTTINLAPDGILIETTSTAYYRTMKVSVACPYDASAGDVQTVQEGRVVRVGEPRNGRRAVAISLSLGAENKVSDSQKETVSPGQRALPTQELGAPLVLVVESESSASEFMKTYLSAEGYEVITVSTVGEARTVLEERTPSLLIAEIEGEGTPGFVLCSHFKQTPRLKPVPVMLLTSSAYPSDYAKAHSLGAVVCMAKPYKRERLGHVVRLLAPPPNADQVSPHRQADTSRNHRSKGHKSPSYAVRS
jgi:CheY-like chemotaxis protein